MEGKFMADALIFDIDGVLLDTSKSFPQVIREAVARGWQFYCKGVCDCLGYTEEHEKIFKRHGSFNDDYDLAWTFLSMAASRGGGLLSRALPTPDELAVELSTFGEPLTEWVKQKYGDKIPRRELRAMCAELYGKKGYGFHLTERPFTSSHWRDMGLPVAIYSGRDYLEWELAKESLGWEDFPDDLAILSDSGITKPSPRGLEILCERLKSSSPVFIGDTASDMRAHSAFGRGRFFAVGSLLPEAKYRFDSTDDAIFAAVNTRVI